MQISQNELLYLVRLFLKVEDIQKITETELQDMLDGEDHVL
jgi:hypothetical protein